jgi:hypothetical protein
MLKKAYFMACLLPFLVSYFPANAQKMNQPMTDFKPLSKNAKVMESPPSDTLIGLDIYVKIQIQTKDLDNRVDYNYVQQWFKQRGFTVSQTQPKLQKLPDQSEVVIQSNPTLIEVYGTLAMTEAALGTKFAVVSVDGVTHTWAIVAPNVPQDIALRVGAIYGLQPYTIEFKSRSVFVDEPQKK